MFKKYLKYKKKYLDLKAGAGADENTNTNTKSTIENLAESLGHIDSSNLFIFPGIPVAKQTETSQSDLNQSTIKEKFCFLHKIEKTQEITCNSDIKFEKPSIFYFLCNQYPFQYMAVEVSDDGYCRLYDDKGDSEKTLHICGKLTKIGYCITDVSSIENPFTYNLITPEIILDLHKKEHGFYTIPFNGIGLIRSYAFTINSKFCNKLWTDLQLNPSQWFIFFKTMPKKPLIDTSDIQKSPRDTLPDTISINQKILQKIIQIESSETQNLNIDTTLKTSQFLLKLFNWFVANKEKKEKKEETFYGSIMNKIQNKKFDDCIKNIEQKIKDMKIKSEEEFNQDKYQVYLQLQTEHKTQLKELSIINLEEEIKKITKQIFDLDKNKHDLSLKQNSLITRLDEIDPGKSIIYKKIKQEIAENQQILTEAEQQLSNLSIKSKIFSKILKIIVNLNQDIDCNDIKDKIISELQQSDIYTINGNLDITIETLNEVFPNSDIIKICKEYKIKLYNQFSKTYEIDIIQNLHEIIKSLLDCSEITPIQEFAGLLSSVIEQNIKQSMEDDITKQGIDKTILTEQLSSFVENPSNFILTK